MKRMSTFDSPKLKEWLDRRHKQISPRASISRLARVASEELNLQVAESTLRTAIQRWGFAEYFQCNGGQRLVSRGDVPHATLCSQFDKLVDALCELAEDCGSQKVQKYKSLRLTNLE
jgi:hypothetical protein